MQQSTFRRLGLSECPVFLAPLAGVSDHPFRRMCSAHGAELTYVEMISATALLYDSKRTLSMLTRHDSEQKLGVQLTAKTPEEMGKAVEKLSEMSFDTIDINMGCPVKKVVNAGCGSAILKDPNLVFAMTKAATSVTDKPVSVKIRLGWDHQSLNYLEVAEAAQKAGAAWLTIHGRTRSDTYANPVNLEAIARLKQSLSIPVLGNGNIFSVDDANIMAKRTNVDGVMVSRGALGNPWIFSFIKEQRTSVSLEDWFEGVSQHLDWQREAYGKQSSMMGIICMRKHLLWYAKGWHEAKRFKEQVSFVTCWDKARAHLEDFANEMQKKGILNRRLSIDEQTENRFIWDPKFEMNREFDQGVGCDAI